MKPVKRVGRLVLSAVIACLALGTWVRAADLDRDAEYHWAMSSGPHGERDAGALPLYEAIFAHDAARVASDLDRGASPNALLYPHRWSPLMIAAVYNDGPIVDVLIKRGADLNYVSDDAIYPTPLAVALATGRFHPNIDKPDFRVLRRLLDAGADVNVEYGFHKDIAYQAATMNRYEILIDLLARGYRRDLPGLRKWMEIGHVDSRTEPEKKRALAAVDRLLK